MVKNITKNTLVSEKINMAGEYLKVIGLIGKKHPETLLIKTRFGIHTFFLKFPIDLIVIDKNNRIVFLKGDIKPNKIVMWNFKYDTVLELPERSIKNSKTEIGDELDIKL